MFFSYPQPPDKDPSVKASEAATLVKKRSGIPQENWMNYWRSDGDLNYHHRSVNLCVFLTLESAINTDMSI